MMLFAGAAQLAIFRMIARLPWLHVLSVRE